MFSSMAFNSVESSQINSKTPSKPSQNFRIVGKIRASTDLENGLLSEGGPWISVSKTYENDSSGGVVVSFQDQSGSCKESIKLNNCYEQQDGNEDMFLKEIKPLVSESFDGKKSTIIAFGARGSGKTNTIQGFEENPGLAVLAMAEVLSMAEKAGNVVSVSFYEVLHDHVYDLLQADKPEIQVFEDAKGKVNLKGLSQINITSLSQFKKLYFSNLGTRKAQPTSELPQRSHKSLEILISSVDESSTKKPIGKINFVDLAGYEDTRRKSSLDVNLVESTRINKSLYALLKVLYSLNANETHVPYRESKLTRALQDSLGRKNKVLIITCLNPFFCHDSLHAMISVSRCLVVNRVISESKRTIGSLSRQPVVLSSSKGKTESASLRKQINSQSYNFQKTNSTIKGRRLFHEDKDMKVNSTIKGRRLFHGGKANTNKENVSLNLTSNVAAPATEIDATSVVSRENAPISVVTIDDPKPENEDKSHTAEISHVEVSPKIIKNDNVYEEGELDTKKEEQSLVRNENASPPLSSLLENLSNTWKTLHSGTPIRPYKINSPPRMHIDVMEPKTPPVVGQISKESLELQANYSSMGRFCATSAGIRQTLVEEYLHFLNTANKEELKSLPGIGERRATYILELREDDPEPFKSLDDLLDIGFSSKQVNNMMRKMASEIFS